MLRQGLKREYVLAICLICALSDAVLIAAGIGGLGTLVAKSGVALKVVAAGGALFLFLYGVRSFLRAARAETLEAAGKEPAGLARRSPPASPSPS